MEVNINLKKPRAHRVFGSFRSLLLALGGLAIHRSGLKAALLEPLQGPGVWRTGKVWRSPGKARHGPWRTSDLYLGTPDILDREGKCLDTIPAGSFRAIESNVGVLQD